MAELHEVFSGVAHGLVDLDPDDLEHLREAAPGHGWWVLPVAVGDKRSTLASFSDVGRFPIPSTNWDSLQDWLGDLSWLGPAEGYLVVLDGEPDPVLRDVLDTAGAEWSDRGTPFVAVVG